MSSKSLDKDAARKKVLAYGEQLKCSLLEFTRAFYFVRTGRKFELSYPDGRESHYLTICRALMRVIKGESPRLIINVPPRYGKTELVINFIAWATAQFPDSNHIYVSYAHSLAKKQTHTVRSIINLPLYKDCFGVSVTSDTSAKDNFETSHGGSVYGVGAGGTITGRGAGIKNSPRYGGCIIMDDMHKPSEVTSDTIRQGIIDWYSETLYSRINGPNVPIIFIGQCLHEADLAMHLRKQGGWEVVCLPALDVAGNALHPQMHDKYTLNKMREESPYVFASQYQQDPQPAGGGIYKPEWFVLQEHEPDLIATFLTCDTAETDKDWNDASVFSFWGLYRIKQGEIDTGLYGLHWIDCLEFRVEPKDLHPMFMDFYAKCMRHTVKPKMVAIEKKSTGATLLSVLGALQGIDLIDIERTKASGSKATRFLEAQQYVAAKQISLPAFGDHTSYVIEHMRKITANDSHMHDDIADTMYDAIKLALIDKMIMGRLVKNDREEKVVSRMQQKFIRELALRKSAYNRSDNLY